jgi:hypothetical protein
VEMKSGLIQVGDLLHSVNDLYVAGEILSMISVLQQ